MPIYEYQCSACCHCFEALMLKADDPSPACPECRCDKVTKLMSAGAIRPQGVASGSGGFTPPPSSCRPSGG